MPAPCPRVLPYPLVCVLDLVHMGHMQAERWAIVYASSTCACVRTSVCSKLSNRAVSVAPLHLGGRLRAVTAHAQRYDGLQSVILVWGDEIVRCSQAIPGLEREGREAQGVIGRPLAVA